MIKNWKTSLASPQGQRISNSVVGKHFGEKIGVVAAVEHFAAEAVLGRMALEKRHGEAAEPTEIVGQGAFAGAAVVLAKGHVQDPVHRLNAPMATNCFCETFAAHI